MNLEPFDWNVVIIGYWNPAILTPAGIGRRLFDLQEGTPLLVEVPIDGLAPHRVKHEGLTVTAEVGRLVVHADAPTYEVLERARKIAIRAMDKLPETPLTAAGFNIRTRIGEPSDELLAATTAGVDNLLSDAGFEIDARAIRRSVKCGDGLLNLNIQQGQDYRIELNFDRQSSKREELVSWLQFPIASVQKTVAQVFEKIVQVQLEGMGE